MQPGKPANFSFSLKPDTSWLFTCMPATSLQSSPPVITVWMDGKPCRLEPAGGNIDIQQEAIKVAGVEESLNGYIARFSRYELLVEVFFAFRQKEPALFIQTIVTNTSGADINIGSFQLIAPEKSANYQADLQGADYCFVNGWQSWSYSSIYSSEQVQRIPRLNFLDKPLWHDAATPITHGNGRFTSDFFTVLVNHDRKTGLLAGYLSQKQQFGHAEVDLRSGTRISLSSSGDMALLRPGSSMTTDWAVVMPLDFSLENPLSEYLSIVARACRVNPRPDTPVGWCSWYHYFTHITPAGLHANIDRLVDLRPKLALNLFQIDDGYEKAVGDWKEFKPEFRDGFTEVVKKAKESGLTPGLWIAPFIVHPQSEIYRRKSKMLLRDARGRLVNSGWNWNRFTTALDLTHPEAIEFVADTIHNAVHEWGFPYLKLDFLYAGALGGKFHNPTRTRAQAYNSGMEVIREAAGEGAYILGCGAPIGSSIGHVDAMRIGADVSPEYKPKYKGIELLFPGEPNIPSVENALQNTVTRAWFHNHIWKNDPDCLLLRTSTNLTRNEVVTQATVTAMTGGLVLLSDDLSSVPPDRLDIARVLLPVIGMTPRIIDWQYSSTPAMLRLDLSNQTGQWYVLSYTNWSDKPKEVVLKLDDYIAGIKGSYRVRSFWSNTISNLQSSDEIKLELPPHGAWLAAVRPHLADNAIYLGSDLHVSQGLEVREWHSGDTGFNLEIDLPHAIIGRTYFYTSRPVKEILVNTQQVQFTQASGIVTLMLDSNSKATITASYQ